MFASSTEINISQELAPFLPFGNQVAGHHRACPSATLDKVIFNLTANILA